MTRKQFKKRRQELEAQLELAYEEMDRAEQHRFEAQWQIEDLEENWKEQELEDLEENWANEQEWLKQQR